MRKENIKRLLSLFRKMIPFFYAMMPFEIENNLFAYMRAKS
jgi:hypothetical protein